jgi:hypothetical protein
VNPSSETKTHSRGARPSTEARPRVRGGVHPPSEAESCSRVVRPSSKTEPRSRGRQTHGRGGLYQGIAVPLERSGVPLEGGCADCLTGRGSVGSFVRVFRFVFVFVFYEFKRVPPGCLGDPYGCPRQFPFDATSHPPSTSSFDFLLDDDMDIAPCSTNHAAGGSSAAAPSSMDVERPRSSPGGCSLVPPSRSSASSSTGGSAPSSLVPAPTPALTVALVPTGHCGACACAGCTCARAGACSSACASSSTSTVVWTICGCLWTRVVVLLSSTVLSLIVDRLVLFRL